MNFADLIERFGYDAAMSIFFVIFLVWLVKSYGKKLDEKNDYIETKLTEQITKSTTVVTQNTAVIGEVRSALNKVESVMDECKAESIKTRVVLEQMQRGPGPSTDTVSMRRPPRED